MPLLLGKEDDTNREWIMALGHGPAILDKKGVRGKVDFASRVIRDKQFKVWVDENKTISRLHDLFKDPFEEENLLNSTEPQHLQVIKKFQIVVDSMPNKDDRPKYESRKELPWDRKSLTTWKEFL